MENFLETKKIMEMIIFYENQQNLFSTHSITHMHNIYI
jgi:hypothetical protein